MVAWKPRGTGNIGKASQPFSTQEMLGGGGGSGSFGAKPSTFHSRQLAKNPPGQRSQVRKIQEDVLRESEEKRSRYRMGYDD